MAARVRVRLLRSASGPTGVFLMVGTSGVGKTETALALADLLYGGPQHLRLVAPLLLLLAGCVTPGRLSDVQTARTALLGFTEEDVRMCAGFPSRTADLGEGRSIWSYEADERSSGISLSAPILFDAGSTNLNLPSGGSCRAQFRFANGRVDRIAYAGNNDSARGRDALCASVVDDCLAYGRSYAKGGFAGRAATD